MLTRWVLACQVLITLAGVWPSSATATPPTVQPELYCHGDDGNLLWYYTNPDDYNQDSLITVNGITPCMLLTGGFYNVMPHMAPLSFSLAFVCDTNRNGLVEVGDFTALGACFGRGVHACKVYARTSDDYPMMAHF